MRRSSWTYLPILKWNRAEQDAFLHVTAEQCAGVIPLIEIQRQRAASLQTVAAINAHHIERCIPAGTPVAVETMYLLEGLLRPAELMANFCAMLQSTLDTHRIIPVIHPSLLDAPIPSSARLRAWLTRLPEVILRLRSDLIEAGRIGPIVQLVRSAGIKPSAIHLLIDQFSLVGRDPATCAANARPYLADAIAQNCASVTLAGGAFPLSLTGYRSGVHDIPRVEWRTWQRLRRGGQFRQVRYSDYGVTNPSPRESLDSATTSPHIAIRYATPAFWRLYQGGRVKAGAEITLKNLCRSLVADDVYSGAGFSAADELFESGASSPEEISGVPWRCRRDSTARHIALTTHSL